MTGHPHGEDKTSRSGAGPRGSDPHRTLRHARWRSLRGRATVAFAALTLVLSAAMALSVWLTVSQFLFVQRERSTVAQVTANADQVQRSMWTQGLSTPEMLSQVSRELGSTSLLVDGQEWFTTSLRIGRDDLPAAFREMVIDGQASRQRIVVDGRTMMAVGVPLAGLGEAYFEVFPLDELDKALRVLSSMLLTGVTIVPPASLALGWWVTKPALRPLTHVADAAAAVAAGNLDVRIDPGHDPELLPIATSFNATAASLQRRVQADARFAADVSHELRSPLTTMVSAIALVEDYRHRLPEGGREALDILTSEVERFARLVQNLLEISRTDAIGGTDLVLTPVRLAEFVRRTLEPRHQEQLRIEDGAASLDVLVDKRRLEQVITNLVDNAEKHGGGLTCVTLRRGDTVATVIVDDAGPGIPAADRAHIFEPFARGPGNERASSDGAGLGLALVSRHARLLGGAVHVEDGPRGGARFVLSLPLEAE
ncbi:HAMP domain-containing histidine kinase [Georgenia sp. EYE_87]|uniref:HAMP domain-containing sensor histidine kinase n=1 Tax=Georgenia sp. EYE_87 TaxID=2853448 RepID=UPI00200531BF|nr:HAMP domain-containing sensor histidine kinase [Georgenia sp. EYE_87]MCK6210414.1 HAMP domain-containing histidine kinase [Georgenia sp. EYE_87]